MRIIPKESIQKFLGGGDIDALFTKFKRIDDLYKQTIPEKRANSRDKSKDDDDDDSKGELTNKDLFKIALNLDGLPMEMLSWVNEMASTIKLSNLIGHSAEDINISYLFALYKIQVMADNKKKFSEAMEAAYANGSLSEPAISLDGKLMVLNKDGDLEKVDLRTYSSNKDNYKLLSVSNLAYLRQWDPSMNGDLDSFDVIRNSMGFEAFQKLIKEAALSIGSSSVTSNGQFQILNNKVVKGLELLSQLLDDDRVRAMGSVTADGLYEYKIIDSTLLGWIKALTDYIRTVLPSRAKTWAAFKTGILDEDKAAETLIFKYLLPLNTESHTFDIDYKGTMDKVMGVSKEKDKKEKEEKLEEEKVSWNMAVINGDGGFQENISFGFGGNSLFSIPGTRYTGFATPSGESVSEVTVRELLDKTGLAGNVPLNAIVFGNNIIPLNLLSHIAVSPAGGAWVVLPCTNVNGKVVPDFDKFEKFKELTKKAIDQLGPDATPELRMELFEKFVAEDPELRDILNNSGKVDTGRVKPFFVVLGLASDLNFTFFKSNDGTKVSDAPSRYMQPTSSQGDIDYFKRVTGLEKEFSTGGWFSNGNIVYKSDVFIPLNTSNRLSAILFSGQKLKDSSSRRIESEAQTDDIISSSAVLMQP